jgi:hypothetical protein
MGIKISQIADVVMPIMGFVAQASDTITSSSILIDSYAWTQFMPESGSSVVNFQDPGKYRVDLDFLLFADSYEGSGNFSFKVVLDEGANEQTIGGGDHWNYRTHNTSDGYISQHFIGFTKTLSSGSHTVKVYGQRLTTSSVGEIEIPRTLSDGVPRAPVVTFTSLSGTGVGGLLSETDVLDAYLDSYETLNNGTFTDITGLSATIRCFEDEVVGLNFQGVCEGGDNAGHAYVRWEVDGTTYYPDDAYAIADYIPQVDERCNLSNSTKTDPLSVGKHIIKIQGKGDVAGLRLLDGASMSVSRYRGGLISVQEDGSDIVGQTRRINFVDSRTNIFADDYNVARIQIGSSDFLELPEQISDPTYSTVDGYVYAKDADGYLELFYIDNYGSVIQITNEGVLNIDLSSHASTHITGQSDEIDGDKLDVDWDPTHYVPDTSPSEVDSADNLTAHLAGIDGYLLELGNIITFGTHIGATNPHEITLDEAYDGSGSGSGRVITLDSGSIDLDADGYSALDIDGYITLNEISGPSPLKDAGLLYTKEVGGRSELHYMDNYGLATQLTVQGAASYGAMYLTDNGSGTTLTSADTYYQIEGSYEDGYLNNFSHSDGTLTYTGTKSQFFKFMCAACFDNSGAADNYNLVVFVSGNPISKTVGICNGGGADEVTVCTSGILKLSTNNTLEIYIKRDGGSDTAVTVRSLNCVVQDIYPS